jgi:O-acetyl-ADP-ribose deacetylase (regulator of RNase III)
MTTIKVFVGDALDVTEGIIVHGCNCQGVMGAGIARAVKSRFPEAFNAYQQAMNTSGLILGQVSFALVNDKKIIVNANTQEFTGAGKRQVNYDAVASCFEKVQVIVDTCRQTGLDLPVIFPLIGAGLAGGNWKIIETIINETLKDDVKKHLYVLSDDQIPSWHDNHTRMKFKQHH